MVITITDSTRIAPRVPRRVDLRLRAAFMGLLCSMNENGELRPSQEVAAHPSRPLIRVRNAVEIDLVDPLADEAVGLVLNFVPRSALRKQLVDIVGVEICA